MEDVIKIKGIIMKTLPLDPKSDKYSMTWAASKYDIDLYETGGKSKIRIEFNSK